MANPTWADVIAIAPGDAAAFANFPSATQAAFLGYATAECDPTAWGTLQFRAIVYLAAHLAKLGLLRGGGMITSESLGPAARAYLAPQGIKGSLGLTAYGAEYDALLRMTPAALGFVSGMP